MLGFKLLSEVTSSSQSPWVQKVEATRMREISIIAHAWVGFGRVYI
jgi:hypothetical protein